MLLGVSAWLRRHPQVVDLVWVLPIMALSLVTMRSFQSGPHSTNGVGYLVLSAALTVPLIWRRRWPRAVFAVVALTAFVQWLCGITLLAADLAVPVMIYTVAATCTLRWAVAAGLVGELGAVLAIIQDRQQNPHSFRWQSIIPTSIFVWAIWLWGMYISTRHKYTRTLEERADRLERERDQQVQIAAAAERARIARELHDVIAHSISVMVVQADGAGYTVDADADRAKRAMETIGTTGRQALSEMRRMLGVLRDENNRGPYEPQPGVEQLAELLAQIRETGLPVELTVQGVPMELPAGLGLTIYRIVQEALTNTRKHAGPNAAAQVALHYGDDAIEVRIRDDGRGAAAPGDGQGHGLVGMRERAAVYGGTVTTGPCPGGGWRVAARLPVREGVNA